MEFWRGNKIDAKFEMKPADVAEAFRKAVLADEHDLKLKWAELVAYPHAARLDDSGLGPERDLEGQGRLRADL